MLEERPSGTSGDSAGFLAMTEPADDTPLITDPLKPEAVDGRVEAVDPPEAKLKMTADAAEISAIRLLDAADAARESIKPSRK
ncbi:hypothetical protein [Brevundimonas sp.]|uniref:hypothetical protein n=1 Tax=Brevundimonas sp. TaxID=1871086 RepID=UPI003BACCC5B